LKGTTFTKILKYFQFVIKQSNIAYGGFNSVNTFIVENKIYGGRCEGIFCIEGGNSIILRNQIYENNDGIVVVTSIPSI